MRRVLLLSVTVLSLGFAPAPFLKSPTQSPSRQELELIQGTWIGLTDCIGGDPWRRATGLADNEIAIHGTQYVHSLRGQVIQRQDITLHPRRDPRRLTLDMVASGMPSPTLVIYRVEGDFLTLCYYFGPDKPGKYPEDFLPGKGKYVVVYKRKRP